MTRLIIPVLVALLVSGPALADETINFVKVFSVNCVRNVENLDALKTYAKLMKWEKFKKEISSMLGRKGDIGWAVRSEGKLYFIGIGSGHTDDVGAYNSCSVVSKPLDANKVRKVLENRFELKPLKDKIEGFMRYQQFNARVSGLPMMMTIISADDPKVHVVTLNTTFFPR